MSRFRVFWGDTHDNRFTHSTVVHPMDEVLHAAALHLDFYSGAYYTAHADAFQPEGHPGEFGDGPPQLILEGWKAPDVLQREWAAFQEATRAANNPGRFVTFPGYEWQGDGSPGDHNVSFLDEGAPVFRVDKLAKLYRCLHELRRGGGLEAVAISHHTAYRPGVRGRDWSVFDEALSPYAELFSVHGCSETDEEWIGLRNNSHMGPGLAPGTYQAALDRGLHVGAICSTDNFGGLPGHYGRGRMAVLAEELTRDALWSAFKARRVYGVTGDRIEMDFTVDGAPMGSVIDAGGSRTVRAAVRGSDAIDRIEMLRNGRVIATHCHQGTWEMPEPGDRGLFKLRVECGWGPRGYEPGPESRDWSGQLELDGGRFVGWEPCWLSFGQAPAILGGARATFALRSLKGGATLAHQNADVFEFEAEVRTPLRVTVDGLTETGTVADFCAGSRVMWFRNDCVRMLREYCDLEPESPERGDIYHHMAHKAKLHRAMPEAAYTATLEFEDTDPLRGETNYRVRVEQRNGQRAWSSPVWVRPR